MGKGGWKDSWLHLEGLTDKIANRTCHPSREYFCQLTLSSLPEKDNQSFF